PEEPAGPRSTNVPVIDVVLMDEMPRPRPFNVPFPEKNVPPGTKFAPVRVTLSIWPAMPAGGFIPVKVGGATDEMRHATRWSIRPEDMTPPGNGIEVTGSRSRPLKALTTPWRSSEVGTYAWTDNP